MHRKYRIILEIFSSIIVLVLVAMILGSLVTGCGHNVVTHSRGIGIDVSWDGSSYIPNLRLGQWDVTNAVVKENVDVEANTITKADVGATAGREQSGSNETQVAASGGIQIKMKTGPQTNGYVTDVLTSETLSNHSVELAKSIYSVKSEMTSAVTVAEVTESGDVKVEQNVTPIATTTTETKTESSDDSGTTEIKTTTTTTSIPVKEETQQAVQEAATGVTTAVESDRWYYFAGLVVVIIGTIGSIIGCLVTKKKNSSATDTKSVDETQSEQKSAATSYDKPEIK